MHSFIAKMVINHFSFCICQATWLKLAETHKNGEKILLRYQPSEEPCGPFLLLLCLPSSSAHISFGNNCLLLAFLFSKNLGPGVPIWVHGLPL